MSSKKERRKWTPERKATGIAKGRAHSWVILQRKTTFSRHLSDANCSILSVVTVIESLRQQRRRQRKIRPIPNSPRRG